MRVIARTSLGLAGVVAGLIGASILAAPQAFFAGNGVVLSADPSLMSEVRAPGGLLLIAGVYLLHQAFLSRRLQLALVVGAAVFGAYGMSRLLSVALDGVPSTSLIAATVVELAIAIILFGLSRVSREGASAGRRAP